MTEDQPAADGFAELRRRAEETVRATEARESPSLEDAGRLLHELRVHQIELEMQNEELRRAQEELEASRARYVDLYDFAPVGYVTVSEAGLIREANLTAATLLAMPRGMLGKLPFNRFVLPEDQDIYYRHRKQLFETGTPQLCELRLLRTDCPPFWARLEATATQNGDNGSPDCRIVMSDISERKRIEEERRQLEAELFQSQRLKSLGVFAAGIAHDFNNILAGIRMFAEILPTDATAATLHLRAGEIKKAVKQGADLTRQILTYAGERPVYLEPLDISQIVEEMKTLLKAAVSTSAVISYDLASELEATLADAGQVRQIIMNLVVNASEALVGKNGTISIATSMNRVDDKNLFVGSGSLTPGDYVYLEITDTGCGMDKQTLDQVFDLFFTTKSLGRGLGLATVHGIVCAHQGAILVTSEPGKGSTFRVFLPATGSPPPVIEQPATSVAKPRGNDVVLIVDDDEMVRLGTKAWFESLGFGVLTASDGVEALEAYDRRRDEIVCVVLDLNMPRMNGEGVLRELRRMGSDVRVILTSGYPAEAMEAKFAGLEVFGFHQKPDALDDLVARLAESLAKDGQTQHE